MIRKICLILFIGITVRAAAQETLIFAAILSNKKYVVGARNAPTGVVVSGDSGRTWQRIGWPNIRAADLHVDDNGLRAFVASGNGVLKTTNGGESWRIMTGWEITEVLEMAVHPADPECVVAGTAYGVAVSGDGGRHWEMRNDGLNSAFCSALEVDAVNEQRLWLGTEDGIYLSDNKGISWHHVLKGLAVRVIIQHPGERNWLWAGTEDHGVYRSSDGGKTWKPANRGIKDFTIYTLACDNVNGDDILAGTHGGGVFISSNRGKSWKSRSRGLKNRMIHSLAVLRDGSVYFAGTINGGIYRSSDRGKNWQFSGLEGAQVWDIKILEREGRRP